MRLLLPMLALVTGCSLIQDYDVEQCEKDRDCAKRGAMYANYVCVDKLCRPFLSCTSDAQCQSRGGSLASYICGEEMQCVPPECTTNEECEEELGRPTASCTNGRCADPKWGCLDDNEPRQSPPTIKFSAAVQDLYSAKAPPGMQAFVCRKADTACTTPLAGPYTAADTAGNVSFSITNLTPAGFDGFVKFTAPGELPLEFQFVKVPLTHDFKGSPSTPFAMLPPGTMTMFGNYVMREIDEENAGLLVARLFDCEGNPAEGLRLQASNIANPDQAFFFISDETYIPNVMATATDDTGVAGLANVPAAIVTVEVIHEATDFVLYDFQLTMNKATFVLAFIYADDL